MQRIIRRHRSRSRRLARRTDEGLTLVEIIVAISLLGIFAIVFAPVLYTNLNISINQTTIAYASQQAATYIDDARADFAGGSCLALKTAAEGPNPDPDDSLTATSEDGRSVKIKVSGQVTCPGAVPGTATLAVTACPTATLTDKTQCDATGRTFAEVSTQILVVTP